MAVNTKSLVMCLNYTVSVYKAADSFQDCSDVG